jgi:hypothetical protein
MGAVTIPEKTTFAFWHLAGVTRARIERGDVR